MRPTIVAALFSALSGALVLGAPQQNPEGQPVISVEANLVTLPVTVLDRRGDFVSGLTSEQFAVYDNGERQPIQFFSSEEMPATVGLVIDSSSSMRAHRSTVTAAATAFGALAHPLDELFSVNFNEAVWPGLPPGVVFASNVDQLHRALSQAPAVGMTALFDAVDRSLDQLQLGTRDRKALVLVSDGGDNASTQTLATVLEHARRSNAVIYAVILVNPSTNDARPDVLRKLARETGGEVFTPRRVEDVMTAFGRIGLEIRSGYLIGFAPPSVANGGFRTLGVVAHSSDGRQLTVRTRGGYYAGRTGGGVN